VTLNIKINIYDVSTEMVTDADLSFDAIESLLTRAVHATLQSYLALPEKDRLAAYHYASEIDNDIDDEEDD
jgi:hypothetical protein